MLTLVATINFWLADKSWRIDLVAAEEYIPWICIAASDVACNVVVASAIMTVIEIVIAVSTAKDSAELKKVRR
jgi:hypothetical protein